MIIPTGIGCEIGGYAGDATPAAKLLASVCDNLIINPNVVNASDINEMPDNCLYVEGSTIDRFLEYKLKLKKVNSNRILIAVNKPVRNEIINAVSAARVTIGANIRIIELKTELFMSGFINSKTKKADGIYSGVHELVEQLKEYENQYEALGVISKIDVDKKTALHYLKNGGVNPWGRIEAIVSKVISESLNKPVAHAPLESGILKKFNEIVDPRTAAECVSVCYSHCIFKGLHKAPRIDFDKGLSADDIDFLISPVNCFGRPHEACIENNIPIIYVSENKNVLKDGMPGNSIIAENYIEAAGIMQAFKIGVTLESLRRPVYHTEIIK